MEDMDDFEFEPTLKPDEVVNDWNVHVHLYPMLSSVLPSLAKRQPGAAGGAAAGFIPLNQPSASASAGIGGSTPANGGPAVANGGVKRTAPDPVLGEPPEPPLKRQNGSSGSEQLKLFPLYTECLESPEPSPRAQAPAKLPKLSSTSVSQPFAYPAASSEAAAGSAAPKAVSHSAPHACPKVQPWAGAGERSGTDGAGEPLLDGGRVKENSSDEAESSVETVRALTRADVFDGVVSSGPVAPGPASGAGSRPRFPSPAGSGGGGGDGGSGAPRRADPTQRMPADPNPSARSGPAAGAAKPFELVPPSGAKALVPGGPAGHGTAGGISPRPQAASGGAPLKKAEPPGAPRGPPPAAANPKAAPAPERQPASGAAAVPKKRGLSGAPSKVPSTTGKAAPGVEASKRQRVDSPAGAAAGPTADPAAGHAAKKVAGGSGSPPGVAPLPRPSPSLEDPTPPPASPPAPGPAQEEDSDEDGYDPMMDPDNSDFYTDSSSESDSDDGPDAGGDAVWGPGGRVASGVGLGETEAVGQEMANAQLRALENFKRAKEDELVAQEYDEGEREALRIALADEEVRRARMEQSEKDAEYARQLAL